MTNLLDELKQALTKHHETEKKILEIIGRIIGEKGWEPEKAPRKEERRRAVQRFYSVKETCELLGGIHRDTLLKLRNAGEIAFVRIGNRPMFAASQIEEYQNRKLGIIPPVSARASRNS